MNHWLMKTEPEVFSFEDLISCPDHTDSWDGIRNYQARNFMRDNFKINDKVFIYHSRTGEPAIVGIAKVVRTAYPDHTALDPKSKYYDSKSAKLGESRWFMVDVKAEKKFKNIVTLKQMKEAKELSGMLVTKKGQRLSIQPVEKKHWDIIVGLGKPQKIT
ncbi:MAG: EVE domain-containing protein [Bdellovibrionota bacterium]